MPAASAGRLRGRFPVVFVPNIGRIAADDLVRARDLPGHLFVRFFTPQAIALEIVIRRKRRHEILRWFRIAEEMLCRVLFLEASTIASRPPPPTPARPHTARIRKRAPVFNREHSSTWRLSFRMTPGAVRERQRKRRARREPRIVVPSRLLALRLRKGLDRFRHLAAWEPSFHGRATLALRDRKGKPGPRKGRRLCLRRSDHPLKLRVPTPIWPVCSHMIAPRK